MEGRAGDLLALAQKLHDLPFKKGVKRVYATIRDDRRDKKISLGDKAKSVRRKLR